MTIKGYLHGTALNEDLFRKLSGRRIKEVSVHLDYAGTTMETMLDKSEVYQIKLYETLRENGKPSYFPDIIVDNVDLRKNNLDGTAFGLLKNVVDFLVGCKIKPQIKISKHFFESGHFAQTGRAKKEFDNFKNRDLTACFIEEDANKVMWMTNSGNNFGEIRK